MLYKRSSFINWLREVKECEISPLPDSPNVLLVKNHTVQTYLHLNKKDRIEYQEIWVACNKLMIDGLPGDNDLERIE